jgi:hypothetical protein
MKKYLLIISLLSFVLLKTKGQDSAIKKSEFHFEISKLSNSINALKKDNSDLHNIAVSQSKQIDSLIQQLEISRSNIQQIADTLHITVTNASFVNKQTQSRIDDLNQTVSSRTLYWIIGILAITVLSIIAFFFLRKKLSSSADNLDSRISQTKQALETEAIKLDSKLAEILQIQLTILKEEGKSKEKASAETDHKLPLKVGEEIHRMRKRIDNMPQDVKGLSALNNSLKRLEEEFNDNGYEIEELLGKKYVDGMKVEARFVDNPNIPKGEEIITDVLRPQIMYKGSVIQVAKVEVGKSY